MAGRSARKYIRAESRGQRSGGAEQPFNAGGAKEGERVQGSGKGTEGEEGGAVRGREGRRGAGGVCTD